MRFHGGSRRRSTRRLVRAVALRCVQKLTGVRTSAVRLSQPGQHPRQFGDAVVIVEAAHSAGPVSAATVDDQVHIGICGDLRQVRDDDDLVRSSKPGNRRPICTAARPPTPASTSSKTIVVPSAEAASTTSSASITRDSSPPDALLLNDNTSVPRCAAKPNSTASTPSFPAWTVTPDGRVSGAESSARAGMSATETVNAASAMASPVNSAVTAFARPLAALVRALVSSVAALTTFASSSPTRRSSSASASSGHRAAPADRVTQVSQHAVDVGGILAGERAQLGLPGQLRLKVLASLGNPAK